MLTILLAIMTSVEAHSWVERSRLDGPLDFNNIGYSRGNVPRSPQFNDKEMTYQLPPDGRNSRVILSSDLICKSTQLNAHPGSNLKVTPGSSVVLEWNENGHITQPWNNGVNKVSDDSGTVFVYGTDASLPSDTVSNIHGVWNAEGKGGDQRGRLLYQMPFDNQKCYTFALNESNVLQKYREASYPPPLGQDPAQNQNLWCTANVRLPDSIDKDLYSLYWVWDWPTVGSISDLYTTCIDVDVKPSS